MATPFILYLRQLFIRTVAAAVVIKHLNVVGDIRPGGILASLLFSLPARVSVAGTSSQQRRCHGSCPDESYCPPVHGAPGRTSCRDCCTACLIQMNDDLSIYSFRVWINFGFKSKEKLLTNQLIMWTLENNTEDADFDSERQKTFHHQIR